MDGIGISFELVSETPGAFRYRELDHLGRRIQRNDDGMIVDLYIRKAAIDGNPPNRLRVVLHPDEG